jgi:hypothetical protein
LGAVIRCNAVARPNGDGDDFRQRDTASVRRDVRIGQSPLFCVLSRKPDLAQHLADELLCGRCTTLIIKDFVKRNLPSL